MELPAKILSDVIIYDKYAKHLEEENRRETWDEIVDRKMNMDAERYPALRDEIIAAYEYVRRREVLGSMRGMQFAGDAVKINPVRQYNCSATSFTDAHSFGEFMFLLLCGTGVGFSVQKRHIRKLPEIRLPIKTRRFLVGDSIEGWSDAVKILMNSYFTGSPRPTFDFRSIRPKGARLKTSGGIAPGPEPLKDCLHNIQRVLDRKENGSKLTSIEVHDIACFMADCVLAGGIRRAATISLFDMDDEDMLTAKVGNWWELNPQRGRANNSAVIIRHKVAKEDFFEFWERVKASGSGEPGFLFSNDPDIITNPCITGDTLVYVADGRGLVPIQELAEAGADVDVFCLDDKGDITIRKMRHPRLTKREADILDIEVEGGHIIQVTPNHKFLTRDGVYVEAKDLTPGTSLRIITRYQSSLRKMLGDSGSGQDYLWINNGFSKNKAEHRYIAESMYGDISGMVVHHADYNSQNNYSDNLVIMAKVEHDALHGKRMRGENNPMVRHKATWSTEKTENYRQKHRDNSAGDRNPNYSGISNEELRHHATTLTTQLQRRFSHNEWVEYATTNKLPTSFSEYRKRHLGTISTLSIWAAIETGIEHYNGLDTRVTKTLLGALRDGYDAFIENDSVMVCKVCEVSGQLFTVPWNRREMSVANMSVYMKNRWETHRENITTALNVSHQKRKAAIRAKQAEVFHNLTEQLGRTPLKREWRDQCSSSGVPNEISRSSSPFKSYSELAENASMVNHKVVSVTLAGSADVYNGTVDDFHNFFVGGFEETTVDGKKKWVMLNNKNCGEISLRLYEFCNLSEINVGAIKTQEDFEDFARVASFLGTLQAGYTDFHYLSEKWQETTEKEALIGVSMTGLASGNIDALDRTKAAKIVLEENKRVAKIIGINSAARATCVKPSGTASLVLGTSSGIHAWHSKFYIRRVTLEKNQPLYMYLMLNHPELVVDSIRNPKQAFLEVPMKAPEDALTRHDESAVQMLNRIKTIWGEWIVPGHRKGSNKNNVSATVNIKADEWGEVAEWMWNNRESYTALSVLPHDGHTYIQAPFEDITEKEYKKRLKSLVEVDLTKVVETTDLTTLQAELACGGSSCEIL